VHRSVRVGNEKKNTKDRKENLFLTRISSRQALPLGIIYYEKYLKKIQCSPANPAQAGEEAVGLADLSGLPSSFCVLVGE